jgi:hypothetical protein
MSDLDEHEEQAEAMLADLEAADAVPESVKACEPSCRRTHRPPRPRPNDHFRRHPPQVSHV